MMLHTYGDHIIRAVYRCQECWEERVYGFSGDPHLATIYCGNCRKHMLHKFLHLIQGWIGRACPLAPR